MTNAPKNLVLVLNSSRRIVVSPCTLRSEQNQELVPVVLDIQPYYVFKGRRRLTIN
jgi:hypothetical protein